MYFCAYSAGFQIPIYNKALLIFTLKTTIRLYAITTGTSCYTFSALRLNQELDTPLYHVMTLHNLFVYTHPAYTQMNEVNLEAIEVNVT